MRENSEAFQMFQLQDYSLRLVTREAPVISAPARIVGWLMSALRRVGAGAKSGLQFIELTEFATG
jgi:hypothetical protein